MGYEFLFNFLIINWEKSSFIIFINTVDENENF